MDYYCRQCWDHSWWSPSGTAQEQQQASDEPGGGFESTAGESGAANDAVMTVVDHINPPSSTGNEVQGTSALTDDEPEMPMDVDLRMDNPAPAEDLSELQRFLALYPPGLVDPVVGIADMVCMLENE